MFNYLSKHSVNLLFNLFTTHTVKSLLSHFSKIHNTYNYLRKLLYQLFLIIATQIFLIMLIIINELKANIRLMLKKKLSNNFQMYA